MTRTEYEQDQADFTQRAHKTARACIYPQLFGTEDIRFSNVALHSSPAARVLDTKLGIDVVAWPKLNERLSDRIPYYIQERFRRPKYERWADITITEYNHASDTPSELYKLGADLLLYGLYDEETELFKSAFAVDVLRAKVLIGANEMPFQVQRNKKEQSFIGVRVKDLQLLGCIAWSQEESSKAMYEIPDSVPENELFDYLNRNDKWLPEELRGPA